MSIEPERPVEKLLRGYARQRREQAGEPPSMHPVVRRQLLSEAAKLYGRRQIGGGWWSVLKGFWPRLALAAGGMAVLIVGAAIWTSSGSKNAELQLAKNEGLQGTSTAIPLERRALTDSLSLAQNTSSIITNNVLVAQVSEADALTTRPPASAVASFEIKQDGRVGAAPIKAKDEALPTLAANAPSRKPEELARDKERSYGEIAPASGAAKPEATSDSSKFGVALQTNTRAETPAEVAKTVTAPMQEQAISFQNTSVTQLFRNQMPIGGQKAPTPASVMAQFRVEQDGAVVRIIDIDESIYTGSLQEAEIPTAAQPAPTVALNNVQRSRSLTAPQPRLDQAQNFRLEVSGTNRTLNQKVVFSGNLVGNQISLSSASQNQQAIRQNQKLQQQLSNVIRISGTVRVGTGANQPVEAVPLQ